MDMREVNVGEVGVIIKGARWTLVVIELFSILTETVETQTYTGDKIVENLAHIHK